MSKRPLSWSPSLACALALAGLVWACQAPPQPLGPGFVARPSQRPSYRLLTGEDHILQGLAVAKDAYAQALEAGNDYSHQAYPLWMMARSATGWVVYHSPEPMGFLARHAWHRLALGQWDPDAAPESFEARAKALGGWRVQKSDDAGGMAVIVPRGTDTPPGYVAPCDGGGASVSTECGVDWSWRCQFISPAFGLGFAGHGGGVNCGIYTSAETDRPELVYVRNYYHRANPEATEYQYNLAPGQTVYIWAGQLLDQMNPDTLGNYMYKGRSISSVHCRDLPSSMRGVEPPDLLGRPRGPNDRVPPVGITPTTEPPPCGVPIWVEYPDGSWHLDLCPPTGDDGVDAGGGGGGPSSGPGGGSPSPTPSAEQSPSPSPSPTESVDPEHQGPFWVQHRAFSPARPNRPGDGRKDTNELHIDVEGPWELRVDGRPSPIALGEGPTVIPWAGQLANGRLLPDGGYTLSLRREGEADLTRTVRLDTVSPTHQALDVTALDLHPDGTRIRWTLQAQDAESGLSPEAPLTEDTANRFSDATWQDMGQGQWSAQAKVTESSEGDYHLRMRVRDQAGNEGVFEHRFSVNIRPKAPQDPCDPLPAPRTLQQVDPTPRLRKALGLKLEFWTTVLPGAPGATELCPAKNPYQFAPIVMPTKNKDYAFGVRYRVLLKPGERPVDVKGYGHFEIVGPLSRVARSVASTGAVDAGGVATDLTWKRMPIPQDASSPGALSMHLPGEVTSAGTVTWNGRLAGGQLAPFGVYELRYVPNAAVLPLLEVDAARPIVVGAFKVINNESGQGWPSFASFKAFMGVTAANTGAPEPQEGYHWHHLVEQSSGFSPTLLHSAKNLVRTPGKVNQDLAAYHAKSRDLVPFVPDGVGLMTLGDGVLSLRRWVQQQPKSPEVFEAIRRSEVALMNTSEFNWRLDDQDKP